MLYFIQCSLSRCKLQAKLPVYPINRDSHMALVVKNPPADVADIRDMGSVPGSGKPPGGGHGNPL